MNYSLILFLITLNHAYADPGGTDIRHEPWIREGKYHCPAENDQDIANIEEASKVIYQLKYCLFEKKFQQSEDRVCKKEIDFLFNQLKIEEGNQCGTTPYQTIHAFSYFYCGEQSALEKFRDKTFRKIPVLDREFVRRYIYLICYDTIEMKVLWTKHRFQSYQLRPDPDVQKLQIQSKLPAISTDPYFMNPKLFLSLETQYALEKKKNPSERGTFIMVPQPLVPPDHLDVPLTKKSTNHYINMAPLWETLVPLMKTIDYGLKLAQMKIEKMNPRRYNDLTFLTKVTPSKEVDDKWKTWFNLLLFEGNIWYKLIYRESSQVAMMIIIHNTPGNPPSKGCLVGIEKKCKFEKWSKDESLISLISGYTMYAYCCEIRTRDVKEVFYRNYKIIGYLEIDNLVTEDKILASKL